MADNYFQAVRIEELEAELARVEREAGRYRAALDFIVDVEWSDDPSYGRAFDKAHEALSPDHKGPRLKSRLEGGDERVSDFLSEYRERPADHKEGDTG